MPLPKARRRNRKDEDTDDSDDSVDSPSSVSDFDEDDEESVIDDTDEDESEASDDVAEDEHVKSPRANGAPGDKPAAGEGQYSLQKPPKVLSRPGDSKAKERERGQDSAAAGDAAGVSGRSRWNYRNHPPTPFQRQRREYNRKLKNDPTFTPFLGQFWAHDDRHVSEESKALIKGSSQMR